VIIKKKVKSDDLIQPGTSKDSVRAFLLNYGRYDNLQTIQKSSLSEYYFDFGKRSNTSNLKFFAKRDEIKEILR
jgi:hypothetical protein